VFRCCRLTSLWHCTQTTTSRSNRPPPSSTDHHNHHPPPHSAPAGAAPPAPAGTRAPHQSPARPARVISSDAAGWLWWSAGLRLCQCPALPVWGVWGIDVIVRVGRFFQPAGCGVDPIRVRTRSANAAHSRQLRRHSHQQAANTSRSRQHLPAGGVHLQSCCCTQRQSGERTSTLHCCTACCWSCCTTPWLMAMLLLLLLLPAIGCVGATGGGLKGRALQGVRAAVLLEGAPRLSCARCGAPLCHAEKLLSFAC